VTTIPQVENVPSLLRTLPCWLLWRSVPNIYFKKPNKVPYYAAHCRRHGALDSPEDRAQLVTFDAAVAAFVEKPGIYAGLAVALGRYGDVQLAGIDLDDVREPDGSYDERAGHIMTAASSYCEVSPSGTGFKIYGVGKIGTAGKSGSGASAEIYSAARFFAYTGEPVNGFRELADLSDAARVAREVFKLNDSTATNKPTVPGIEDDALLRQLDARQMVKREVKPGVWSIRCPWEFDHTSGDSAATTVLFLPHHGGYQGHAFDCKHSHCQHRKIDDLRGWLKSSPATKPIEEDTFMSTSTTVRPVQWLLPGWIAKGKFHVFAGAAGVSKSACMMEICAALSRGNQRPTRPPLLGIGPLPVVKSLFCTFEDDYSDTVLPRLIAAEADLDNVVRAKPERLAELLADKALLAAFINKHGIELVVIDVLDAALELEDSHDGTQVRRSVQPWVDLATGLDIAVMGLRHLRKAKEGDLQDQQIGSVQFTAAPRITWHAMRYVRDVDGRKHREVVLVRAKSNCSAREDALVYELEPVTFDSPMGKGDTIRINWLRTMPGSPEEIYAACRASWQMEKDLDKEPAIDAAKAHLRAFLGDGLWHRVRDMEAAAPMPDKFSKRTLGEARTELRIEARKGSGGLGDIRLPPDLPPT